MGALGRYLHNAELSLADVFGSVDVQLAESIEDRIRSTYADLAPRPGGWVGLARLRAELSDADRGDVDSALRTLYRAPGVSLIPEENQKVLTAEDRDAAILIGDQSKHLIAIET